MGRPMNEMTVSWTSAIGISLTLLMAYMQGAFCIPFLYGLGAVRIRADGRLVVLGGLDAAVSSWAGVALCVLAAVGISAGVVPGVVTSVLALVVWFGFRVDVRVDAVRTRVVRTFLYAVPWNVRRYGGDVEALADGWGDEMDPRALYVQLDRGATKIELAWEGRDASRRAHDLAAEFNRAVANLKPATRGTVHPYR